jgi:hypothetical protein
MITTESQNRNEIDHGFGFRKVVFREIDEPLERAVECDNALACPFGFAEILAVC